MKSCVHSHTPWVAGNEHWDKPRWTTNWGIDHAVCFSLKKQKTKKKQITQVRSDDDDLPGWGCPPRGLMQYKCSAEHAAFYAVKSFLFVFVFVFYKYSLLLLGFLLSYVKKKKIGLGVLLHSAHLWVSLELWSSHKLRISHIKQYDVSSWKTVSALMLSLFQTRLINKLINKQTGQEGGGAKLGSGVFPQISGFISGHATFVVFPVHHLTWRWLKDLSIHPSIWCFSVNEWTSV